MNKTIRLKCEQCGKESDELIRFEVDDVKGDCVYLCIECGKYDE